MSYKKDKKKEEDLYGAFMSICSKYDDELVDTKDKDEKETMKACAMQYIKMKPVIDETSEGGLTEKQKKLPLALQKAILKKQEKEEVKEKAKASEEAISELKEIAGQLDNASALHKNQAKCPKSIAIDHRVE